jgi:hypothetical protein
VLDRLVHDVMRLCLSLSGPDPAALLRAAAAAFFGGRAPATLRVDGAERYPGGDWARLADRLEAGLMARFPDAAPAPAPSPLPAGTSSSSSSSSSSAPAAPAAASGAAEALAGLAPLAVPWISLTRDGVVKLACRDPLREVAPLLAQLAALPFELAVGALIFVAEWRDRYPMHEATCLGGGHFPNGWMCAFRGAGHRRLVSRRWLEHGPWRLHRGANDTSLVQFHALDADPAAALEQARPGHLRMGVSGGGGFLQADYFYTRTLDAEYLAADRDLRFTIADRDVSEVEMLDACAMRHYQILGPDQPIERVSYVFADEARARAHLHQLWLRELECWAIIDAAPTRLDTAYASPPTPPPWACAPAT